jgi:hypothetical protein
VHSNDAEIAHSLRHKGLSAEQQAMPLLHSSSSTLAVLTMLLDMTWLSGWLHSGLLTFPGVGIDIESPKASCSAGTKVGLAFTTTLPCSDRILTSCCRSKLNTV